MVWSRNVKGKPKMKIGYRTLISAGCFSVLALLGHTHAASYQEQQAQLDARGRQLSADGERWMQAGRALNARRASISEEDQAAIHSWNQEKIRLQQWRAQIDAAIDQHNAQQERLNREVLSARTQSTPSPRKAEPPAQRFQPGSNTNARDQLDNVNDHSTKATTFNSDTARAEAAKGFDEGGGQSSGHHGAVKISGTASGHPGISAVPDKYKNNPEIMRYDHEAKNWAAKGDQLKQDLARLEQKRSSSNDHGKTGVEIAKVRDQISKAQSHVDAAEINKKEKIHFEEGKLQ
jgi:hypothetical protein